MNKIKNTLIAFFIILSISSCSDTKNIDVSEINIDSKLIRFDSLFYTSNPSTLSDLKKNHPLMFPKEYHDSVWVNKINDKSEQKIYRKSIAVFGDFNEQHQEIISALKHIKYYFPKFQSPNIYTILSDFDYQYPILYSGKRLFISLDMYLGQDAEEYASFPNYLTPNMRSERIKIDVSDAILRTIISKDPYNKNLLNNMIYNGKLLYLNKMMNPTSNDSLVIGYSGDEITWCNNNERDIWTYLVKNKYLYNNDPKLSQRFIDVAPFSKFFLDLDRESPGRVGVWLGWQIVNSYMKNNNVTIEELVKNNNSKDIFIKSKYKPNK